MADLDIKGSVDIQTSVARRAMNALAREVESYNKITDKSSSAARSARAGIKQLSDTVDMLTTKLAAAEKAQRAYETAARKAASVPPPSSGVAAPRVQSSTPVDSSQLNVSDRAMSQGTKYKIDEQAKINRFKEEEAAISNKIIAISRKETEEVKQQGILIRANAAATEAGSRTAYNNSRAQTEAVRQRVMLERAAAAAQSQQEGRLNEARYALYDVARGLTVTSVAAAALAIAPVAMAVKWEDAFASVRRVTDGTDGQVAKLKDNLVGLVQSVPADWAAVTQIATLAGQMGIGREQAVQFTSAVAKFTATTDVSVEDAATAFGRLNSLLPDVKGNFEGLGDSVLKVGVNSVATESQIVRITTQIASIAGGAGYTSEQVIGLAGALASVAVPPELSRGVITRVFGDIADSVSNGGVQLNGFARLAGMSAEDFSAAWKERPAEAFNSFMNGIEGAGSAAQSTLNSLGITSVRDVPVLIRLANAADSAGQSGMLLEQTMFDASNAAGEMARQYEISANTTAGKLQILSNSFEAFLATAGESSLGPLGVVIEILNDNLRTLTDFVKTDAGAAMTGFGVILAGVVAVIAAIGGIAAMGIGGLIALTLALRYLQGQATNTAISYGGLLTMLRNTGPLGSKAARGIGLVGRAAGLAAAATALLVLPDLFRGSEDTAYKYFSNYGNTAAELVDILDNVGDSQGYVTKQIGQVTTVVEVADTVLGGYLKNTSQGTQEINRALANFGLGGLNDLMNGFYGVDTAVTSVLKRTDDSMADLVRGGNVRAVIESFDHLAQTSGKTFEGLLNSGNFPELKTQLATSGIEVKTLADGTLVYSNQLGQTTTDIAEFTGELSEAEKVQADFEQTLSDGRTSFIDFSSALTDATNDAGDFSFDGFIEGLKGQIAEQETWSSSMLAISGKVSAGLLGELAKLGPEGLPLIQALTTAAPEELAVMEDAFKRAGEQSGAAFATAVVGIQGALAGIARAKGQEAADALAAGLLDGTVTVDTIIAEWTAIEATADVEITADPTAADETLNNLTTKERRASIKAEADQAGIDDVNQKLGPNGGVSGTRPSSIAPYVDGVSYDTANRKLGSEDLAKPRHVPLIASVDEGSAGNAYTRMQELFSVPITQTVETVVKPGAGGVSGTRGYTGGLVGALQDAQGYASGGKIPGPRQANRRTDNVLMWGRSHEFMMNEQATNYYGEDFFNALNNRALDTSDFMRPVPVAVGGSGAGNGGTSVVELSMRDRQLLQSLSKANLNVNFAPSDAAQAASKGNSSRFQKGAN